MMTALLFVFVATAAAWVIIVERTAGPDRSLRWPSAAWQLAALSFTIGPDLFDGNSGKVASSGGLLLLSAAAIVVHNCQQRRWRITYTPWIVFYVSVLLVSAIFSSAPSDAFLRSGRAMALLFLFGQTASALPLQTVRKLFSQFIVGCAAAVVTGAIVAPSIAFSEVRAPVLQVQLEAPILGFGAHWTGAIGLCLLGVAISYRPVGRLGMVGATTGLAILILAQKRAFWLAAVVALLVWVFLRYRQRFVQVALATMVIGAMFATVEPLRDLWDREQSRPAVENITTIRRAIFDESIERFLEHPVIGDGLGVGNRDLLIDVGQEGFRWTSHDEFGAALAATGLLGFLAVAWGNVFGFAAAVRSQREGDDALPLIVASAALALLPFWRVLQEPLIVFVPYVAFVMPAYRWRFLDVGWPTPRPYGQ